MNASASPTMEHAGNLCPRSGVRQFRSQKSLGFPRRAGSADILQALSRHKVTQMAFEGLERHLHAALTADGSLGSLMLYDAGT